MLDDIVIHSGIPDADHAQAEVVEIEKLLVVPVTVTADSGKNMAGV